jgi:hypothetical protein
MNIINIIILDRLDNLINLLFKKLLFRDENLD